MTKKVFIGVLTALMLFAFVACDSGTPTYSWGGKNVIGVNLASDQTFYGGDEISSNGVIASVILQYDDGTSSQPVNGILTLSNSATMVKAGNNPAAIKLSGDSSSSTVSFPVNVEGIGIVSLAANTDDAKTEFNYSDVASYDGVVVTATYEDGTTKVLKSTDWEPSLVPSETTDEVGTVTISLNSTLAAAAIEDYTKATYDVVLKGYEVAEVTTSYWKVVIADDNDTTNTTMNVTWGDSVQSAKDRISVVAVMSDGTEETVSGSQYSVYINTNATSFTEWTTANTTIKSSYTITLNARENGVKWNASTATANQAATIAVTVVDPIDWDNLLVEPSKTAANFKVGGTLVASDVTVTLKKASGLAVSSPSVAFLDPKVFTEDTFVEKGIYPVTVYVSVGTEGKPFTFNSPELAGK